MATKPAYVAIVTPVTTGYGVEKMSSLELDNCVGSFLQDLCARTPLEQLATFEANPGLILPVMLSKDCLFNLSRYWGVCNL